VAFIQIVEFRTSDPDAMRKLGDEYEQASEGKRTVRRAIVANDRNDPERYLTIVFFDSYESAMENSKLPETAEFAQRLGALMSGPPTFHDLDVVEDRE